MSSLWGDFEHDPRTAGNADLRASDRDRDTVTGVLGTAYAGTPFPWPIFVSLGTGIRAARMLTDKEDRIVAIQRRLEKKQAKELGSGA